MIQRCAQTTTVYVCVRLQGDQEGTGVPVLLLVNMANEVLFRIIILSQTGSSSSGFAAPTEIVHVI